MAQRFLDRLLKVRKDELPTGAECMICREEYGTVASDNGTIEHAVLLPCGHDVGSECIAIWLAPGDGPGNSCPLCRTVFFPTYLRDNDDDEDEDGDEYYGGDFSDESDGDEEDGGDYDVDEEGGDGRNGSTEQTRTTMQAAFQRVASSSVIDPAQEGIERGDDQHWFQRWPLPTSQQIEDHQKRAQQAVLRAPPIGFLQTFVTQTQPSPTDLESKVAQLASAYRTMAFRETLLYMFLREIGARMPPLRSPHNGLSAHHEEMLLWELGQRGAFSATQITPRHMAMTNRQAWYVHRLRGEVYTYEIPPANGTGYWSTELGFELAEA